MSAITQMQDIVLIQDYMKEIEPFRVTFALKRMKLKHIRTSTVKLMRACIALHDFGLPVSTDLVSTVLEARRTNILARLHTLGDKKCLLLKRRSIKIPGHPLEWTIDPLFLECYK